MYGEGLRGPLIDRYGPPDGPPDGPLVILIHGAVVNRAVMEPLARALAPHVRVLVPDLPGHGSRRDEPFTLESALAQLQRLLAEARAFPAQAPTSHAEASALPTDGRASPVVVAGDSLGGYLALALAARCGGLAGVVAGGCSFPMRGWASLGASLTDVPVAVLTQIAGEHRVERMLLGAFRSLGGDPQTSSRIGAIGLRLAARSESIAALRTFDQAATVRSIGCPVTFVNGGRDIPIVWLANHYARIARSGRAVSIAASTHGVMALQPQAVAAEIESLLGIERE